MITRAVRVPTAPVVLSTASVYPENTASAFDFAHRLGYDGIEIMVWNDPISQDPGALARLSERYDMPVVAIHAPCLVITQRVWGMEPWGKLRRAKEVAAALGASTVVVHPPFRWQTDYARTFRAGLAELAADSPIRFAVENMFPLRVRGREVSTYAPHWVDTTFPHLTLDVSHASVARADVLALYEQMGDRLAHVHIGDGTGLGKDEHLVPGRGDQPCGELLERLARDRFAGAVVVEINSRRAADRDAREEDLAESLAFTRLYLAAPSEVVERAAGGRRPDDRDQDAQDRDQHG